MGGILLEGLDVPRVQCTEYLFTGDDVITRCLENSSYGDDNPGGGR